MTLLAGNEGTIFPDEQIVSPTALVDAVRADRVEIPPRAMNEARAPEDERLAPRVALARLEWDDKV